MNNVKEINIKNCAHFPFDDMVNINDIVPDKMKIL